MTLQTLAKAGLAPGRLIFTRTECIIRFGEPPGRSFRRLAVEQRREVVSIVPAGGRSYVSVMERAVVEKRPRRNTRQRQVVLEELKNLSSHPTAAELYEITRARLPKISLGTVYRNLELLVQGGVIQKLEISGSEARFDGNPERHYHVRCVRCGRVDDVHDLPGDFVQDEVKNLGGYEILECRLEFIGICPACGSRDAPE